MFRRFGKNAVWVLIALVPLAGCDRQWSHAPKLEATSADSDHAPAEAGEVTSRAASVVLPGEGDATLLELSAAITQWRQWRDRKQYRLLRPHIDPANRAVFLDTLVAADLVLAANQEACGAIEDVLGAHRTELWDLSSLGGDLGLFSSDFHIIQVERKGAQATVTFQVGERLPLEAAYLRLGPQGWIYFPGPGPYELPSLLRELAVTLSETAERVRQDRPDVADINQEYRLRVFPRLLALQRAGRPLNDRDP
ncbi:MAG: hypothetical protein JSU68_14650 [Phycisphaerales bacterium]|nr:MAG: hypothetical protein JSU68_14650 [Phycisphaerales bacterium]